MANIIGRIGMYNIVAEPDETFLICRSDDGLEWGRAVVRSAAHAEAQTAASGFDAWRQASRGTGLMPSDFGRTVNLRGEFLKIVGFVPAAKKQKVIVQDRDFNVTAFTVEEVLRALQNCR